MLFNLDNNLQNYIFEILATENQQTAFYNLSRTTKYLYQVSKQVLIEYSILEIKRVISDPKAYFQFQNISNSIKEANFKLTLDAIFDLTLTTGYKKLLKILLKKKYKYDLELLNEAFLDSCELTHLNIIKLLLDNNVDINTSGNQPLYKAVSNNDYDVVKLLIFSHAVVDKRILKKAKKNNVRKILKIVQTAYNRQNNKI